MRWLEEVSPNWQQDIQDANSLDALAHAEVVVALEGPDHLAELAGQLRLHALSVQHCWARMSLAPFVPPRQDEAEHEVPPPDLHTRLKESVREFTQVARAHLNTH
ncbi:hypothetical protein [Streptomyces sp. NPDC099088]|uniref:hypothetical protein n=1 Tax=Streptomyces sp. NPDC099088 TaxID=3366101 RepID=UPI0037F9E8FE